jgi:hypothetical protein
MKAGASQNRWIPVTKETVERWKLERRIAKEEAAQGYIYHNSIPGKKIWFHVDDFDFVHLEAEEMGFGAVGGT